MNRDTQKCAYKVSHAVVDGEEKEVYKEPITGTWKKSKRGRLSLQCDDGVYRTIEHGQGDEQKVRLVCLCVGRLVCGGWGGDGELRVCVYAGVFVCVCERGCMWWGDCVC